MKKCFISLALFFTLVLCVRGEIRMASVFADHMVLQQQSSVDIWGWGRSGAQISVTTSWDQKTYTTKSNSGGAWRLSVTTPKGSFDAHTITISDGKEVVLSNVLIGEVWLCSGQSNMAMTMRGYGNQPVEGAPDEIMNAKNNYIRQYKVRAVSTHDLKDDVVEERDWEAVSAGTTPNFSAAAYYFAKTIFHQLQVPIGLLNVSKGGSSILAWSSAEALSGFDNIVLPNAETKININRTPTGMFNAMIHPLVGYGIRGAIWYQGESDKEIPDLYIKYFGSMVNNWRELWGRGDFPFYYAQIAPFIYTPQCNTAYMREAQMKCMDVVKNSGMAVLMDSNSADCIHPAKKKEVGERLARWALAKTYGIGILYASPVMKGYEVKDGKMVVTMDMRPVPGLTSYGEQITEFVIAGEDRVFYRAEVKMKQNVLTISAPEVEKPVAVRYAFENASKGELFCVESGLPISSFRTDNW